MNHIGVFRTFEEGLGLCRRVKDRGRRLRTVKESRRPYRRVMEHIVGLRTV